MRSWQHPALLTQGVPLGTVVLWKVSTTEVYLAEKALSRASL